MEENQESPPPGIIRDHEQPQTYQKNDVLAVAGLLGQVSGALNEIDKRNVGSDGLNIKANKFDPKSVLKTMVNPAPPPVAQPVDQMPTQPSGQIPTQPDLQPVPVNSVPQATHALQPPVQNADLIQLQKRIESLERTVERYKSVVKFKRGISYTVNTSKITGDFKDFETIMELVAAELSKQTKTITLKLNDKTKN